MQQKGMKKFILLLLLILFSFQAYASDYDAFILNFLRVTPSNNAVLVEMVLDVPLQNNIESNLKNGKILKFIIDTTISQKQSMFRSKIISESVAEYHIHYDPLTFQFLVIDNTKTVIKNTDLEYLLSTFIHNLQFKIPVTLENNHHYYMNINVSLTQKTAQSWLQTNFLFLSDKIVQPATFKYEFDY